MNDIKVGIIKKTVKNLIIFKNFKFFNRISTLELIIYVLKLLLKNKFWEEKQTKNFLYMLQSFSLLII